MTTGVETCLDKAEKYYRALKSKACGLELNRKRATPNPFGCIFTTDIAGANKITAPFL